MFRFLSLVLALVTVISFAAPGRAEPVAEEEVNPNRVYQTLEDWGVSASLNGNRITVDGYTDAVNDSWNTAVEVKFYIYRSSGSLYKSSPAFYEGGWHVSQTWVSPQLPPGAYIVKARHRGWNVSDGVETKWSEFWFCFEVR